MSIVCTICQELITERPPQLTTSEDLIIMAMLCGHVYHRNCILEWFQKLGSPDGSGSCPCCKALVAIRQGVRIYPTGDGGEDVIADRVRRVKEQSEELRHTRGELDQMTMILEDMGGQLQGEKDEHDNLKFSHAQTLSELDEFKRQIQCRTEAHASEKLKWREMWEKVTVENNDLLAKLQLVEEQKEVVVAHISQLERKLELESANKNSIRIRELEELHLNEIRRFEKVLNRRPTAHKSSQTETDEPDAALLQARLVSYKSCVLHMQNEMHLLEIKLNGKLKPLEDDQGSGPGVESNGNDETENISTSDIGSSVAIIEESSTSGPDEENLEFCSPQENKMVAMSIDGGGDCENVNKTQGGNESCLAPEIITEPELYDVYAAQPHWEIAQCIHPLIDDFD